MFAETIAGRGFAIDKVHGQSRVSECCITKIQYTTTEGDITYINVGNEITENTFNDNLKSKLKTVEIPEEVREIGEKAFKDCYNLESITFALDNISLLRLVIGLL